MPKALFLLTVTCFATHAGTVQFIQDGWAAGGPLQLSFAGVDSNVDGWIDQSELNLFQADFRLPDGSSTTWLLGDIQQDGFMFADVGNFLIFTTNSDYSLVNVAFEGEALGSVFDRFLFPIDETEAGLTATPEPSGMLYGVLAMVGGIVSFKRCKSDAQQS